MRVSRKFNVGFIFTTAFRVSGQVRVAPSGGLPSGPSGGLSGGRLVGHRMVEQTARMRVVACLAKTMTLEEAFRQEAAAFERDRRTGESEAAGGMLSDDDNSESVVSVMDEGSGSDDEDDGWQ